MQAIQVEPVSFFSLNMQETYASLYYEETRSKNPYNTHQDSLSKKLHSSSLIEN